ncbi:MAG TPA: YihY/virulence factor BrkB family protein [Caulobacteraceae bacterium]
MDWRRLTDFDYHPTHWALAAVRVAGRSWRRTQNRSASLYVGGVCFYALLAVFPALAIVIGGYSLMMTPQQAAAQAVAFSHLMPPGPQAIFEAELQRIAHAPIRVVSAQSAFAVVVAFYASHRGVKALLAGLSLIHDEIRPRGIVGFNLVALAVAVAGFALIGLISGAFLAVRVAVSSFYLPLTPHSWIFSEWTWASLGMMVGLTLTYRFAMGSNPVPWRASAVGGITASTLTLLSSWAGAYYVQEVAHFGATYGSISGVVILLVWLSWNVNAMFYGGAVATEMEILARRSDMQLRAARDARAPRSGS